MEANKEWQCPKGDKDRAVTVVEYGQGVALAPAVLARADIEAGRLEELWRADEDGPHGYYIVTPKSADSVAIEAMSKWLKTLVS